MARGWQRVVLCGFQREACVSRHQPGRYLRQERLEVSVPTTAWFYRLRCHGRRQTFSRRRACGAKRFGTLYGGTELADDFEEMSPAIRRQGSISAPVGIVKQTVSAGRLRISKSSTGHVFP